MFACLQRRCSVGRRSSGTIRHLLPRRLLPDRLRKEGLPRRLGVTRTSVGHTGEGKPAWFNRDRTLLSRVKKSQLEHSQKHTQAPAVANPSSYVTETSAQAHIIKHTTKSSAVYGGGSRRPRRYYYPSPSSPLLHQNVRSRNAEKDTRKEEGNARGGKRKIQGKRKQARQSAFSPSRAPSSSVSLCLVLLLRRELRSRLRRHRKTNCATASSSGEQQANSRDGAQRERGEKERARRTTPNQSARQPAGRLSPRGSGANSK